MGKQRVFCIGLSRTGTTSFNDYLNSLGYEAIHYPSKIQLFAGKYDAASDIPVVRYFRELDKTFKKSKFVYTIRDNWIDAVEPYFLRKKGRKYGHEQLENRQSVYGAIDFDRKKYEDAYKRHDEAVREYFTNRPDDLLVLNIIAGENPSALNAFLEIKNGKDEFPKSNARKGW